MDYIGGFFTVMIGQRALGEAVAESLSSGSSQKTLESVVRNFYQTADKTTNFGEGGGL